MYLLSFRGGGEVREGSKKCFRFETEGITNHPCTPSISSSFESLLKKKKKISPRIRGSRVDRTVRVKGAATNEG